MTYTDPLEPEYSLLQLSSASGLVYRKVKTTPPRNALPHEIPIIDISNISHPSPNSRFAVAKKIHTAASTSGFFYIKNHGVPSSTTDAAQTSTLSFSRQPPETKEFVNAKGSKGGLEGWKPAESQQINSTESIDRRETFSLRYDPSYDPSITKKDIIPVDVEFLSNSSEFLWENEGTKGVKGFQDDVLRYWIACLELARKLLGSFALGLGMHEDAFSEKAKFPDAVLALNYYPPLPKPSEDQTSLENDNSRTRKPQEVSIGSHTDFQLLTILHASHPGLQILIPSSSSPDSFEWINAPPIPETLIVNIGDLMQRITNDRYVSTVHRAQNFSGAERVSMPFFFGFGLAERAEVLSCCVDEEGGRPRKYRDVGCEEWVRARAEGMFVK